LIVTADGRFTSALRALTKALDELGAPSMIIGGIAVIAAGVPRETIDIDATVLLIVYKAAAWRDRDRADIERLLTLYVDRIDLKRVRGLIDQISAALEDPNRVQLFDEMVERARRSR
jgi:hypothetical protein